MSILLLYKIKNRICGCKVKYIGRRLVAKTSFTIWIVSLKYIGFILACHARYVINDNALSRVLSVLNYFLHTFIVQFNYLC